MSLYTLSLIRLYLCSRDRKDWCFILMFKQCCGWKRTQYLMIWVFRYKLSPQLMSVVLLLSCLSMQISWPEISQEVAPRSKRHLELAHLVIIYLSCEFSLPSGWSGRTVTVQTSWSPDCSSWLQIRFFHFLKNGQTFENDTKYFEQAALWALEVDGGSCSVSVLVFLHCCSLYWVTVLVMGL